MENGIAYGFLYCSALKEELERELQGIKRATNIPDLDFLVMETTDLLKEDQIPISFAGVSDEADLRALIEKHVLYTESSRGKELLNDWATSLDNFVKVMPTEYKKALKRLETEEQMVEELTA